MRFQSATGYVGFSLFLFGALVVFAGRFVLIRHGETIAHRENAKASAHMGALIQRTLNDGIVLAEMALTNKDSSEGITTKSDLLVGAALVTWSDEQNHEGMRVETHIANSSLLKKQSVPLDSVVTAIKSLQNDILSAGTDQEQIYSVLLGKDFPCLVAIVPRNDGLKSLVSVLSARPFGPVLMSSNDSFTYLVDRYGTILLHPEQQRAVHRENIGKSSLAKSLLFSSDDNNAISYVEKGSTDAYLAYISRIEFSGAAVITQTEKKAAVAPFIEAGITLSLLGIFALIAITTSVYCWERLRTKPETSRNTNSPSTSDLKLAG